MSLIFELKCGTITINKNVVETTWHPKDPSGGGNQTRYCSNHQLNYRRKKWLKGYTLILWLPFKNMFDTRTAQKDIQSTK